MRRITNAQRTVFEQLGCIVEEAEPDWAGVDETFRTLRLWARELQMGELVKQHPEFIKETIRWEVEQATGLTAHDAGIALLRQTEIYHRMRQFLSRYEFFVLPVSQVPPFDVTTEYPAEIDGVRMDTYIDWMKSCYYISLTVAPAMSVPCGFTAEGLPVGIQIVGRHRDDFGLLQMAHAFEQAVGIQGRPNL